jgi:predicted dinucleotide-binding enzyme
MMLPLGKEPTMTMTLSLNADRRELLRLFAAAGLAAGSAPLNALAQNPAGLKIGAIGAGREGGAIGSLFAKSGHKVMFSSRKPEELKDLVAQAGPNASAGTVADAVAFADVIVLAVPYTAMEQIGKDYGKAIAAKRLVIDASNPVARRDGDATVRASDDMGGPGLATAKLIPGVKLVRAFNAISYAKLDMDAATGVGLPMIGDDAGAIALATALIKQTGLQPVLVGGLNKGKYMVPGTPLAGEHTPAELKQIAAGLS